MTRLTSKDLAQAMGLKPGDKIKLNNGEIAKVTEDYELDFYPLKTSLSVIIDEEFEISPRKKKIGELTCEEISCEKCPMEAIYCGTFRLKKDVLYDVLSEWFKECNDKEIYDILKARLDMEVEE